MRVDRKTVALAAVLAGAAAWWWLPHATNVKLAVVTCGGKELPLYADSYGRPDLLRLSARCDLSSDVRVVILVNQADPGHGDLSQPRPFEGPRLGAIDGFRASVSLAGGRFVYGLSAIRQ